MDGFPRAVAALVLLTAALTLAGCAGSKPPQIGDVTEARALSDQGLQLFEQGDYAGAMADLDAVIKFGTIDDRDYTRRASVYGAMKQYDKALADTDKALALDPNEWRTYLQRALFHQRLGQFDAAIADLDTAIAGNPNPVELLRRRAYLKVISGHFDGAIADYDALSRRPDTQGDGLLGHGVVLYLQGNWRGAAEIFEHILTADPNDGLTALWLAKASLRGGLPEDWQQFSPHKETDPGWTMADALLHGENADQAAATVVPLAQRGVSACEQSLFLGTWRVIRAKGDGAANAFQTARKECPNDSIEGAEARVELDRLAKAG